MEGVVIKRNKIKAVLYIYFNVGFFNSIPIHEFRAT